MAFQLVKLDRRLTAMELRCYADLLSLRARMGETTCVSGVQLVPDAKNFCDAARKRGAGEAF
jgi:hypothetical protein